MDCPDCGEPTTAREDFCRRCGAYLSWEVAVPPGAGELRPDADPEPPPRPAQTGAVDLLIQPEALTVAPGESVTARVTVLNKGTRVEDFALHAEGPSWITVVPATVKVFRGEENSSELQISPPRAPGTSAGTFAVRVVCRSEVTSGLSAARSVRLQITPFREFEVTITPTQTDGGRRTLHQLALTNRGNQPVRATIEITDGSGRLEFRHPRVVRVAPGQRADVGIVVLPTRKLIGQPESFRFDVRVAPGGGEPPTTVSAVRRVYPWLPSWAPPAAVVMVGLATVLTLLLHDSGQTAKVPIAPTTTGPVISSGATGGGPASSTGPAGPSGSGSPPTSAAGPDSTGSTDTQVVVPALGGKPKSAAIELLTSQGLQPEVQTHADLTVPAGSVIRTTPRDGTAVARGTAVTLVVSSGPPAQLDLVAHVEDAAWTDGAGNPLTPGVGVDEENCGFVALRRDVGLEDGTTAQFALETCPAQGQPGNSITGVYPLPGRIAKGDRFRTRIGFFSGSPGHVRYRLQIRTEAGDQDAWTEDLDGRTHQVLPVDFDLSRWAGGTAVILSVTDIGDGTDDRALWADARITSEG